MTHTKFYSVVGILLLISTSLSAQFMSVQDGDWNDCNTWGTCDGSGDNTPGDGFPGVNDDVFIANSVTVDDDDDNALGVANEPSNIGIAGVCECGVDGTSGCNDESFPECGEVGFHHAGKITIQNGGSLLGNDNGGLNEIFMFSDTVVIENGGTLDLEDDLFITGGFLDLLPGGSLIVDDDLLIGGSGVVNLNGDTDIADDLRIDGDDAAICGGETIILGEGLSNNTNIIVENISDSEVLDQVCSEITIICEDGDGDATNNDCCDVTGGAGLCPTDLDNAAGAGDGTIEPGDGVGDTGEILPVELAYFRALEDDDKVIIEWATYTETDNDFFTIEKSLDLTSWEAIGTTNGQGNSIEYVAYRFEDRKPTIGVSYYRTKQTDFNGDFSYSSIVPMTYGEVNVSIYPIPSQSGIINLYSSVMVGPDDITLYNTFGQKINVNRRSTHNVQETILDLSDLDKGIYMLNLNLNGIVIQRRIIID